MLKLVLPEGDLAVQLLRRRRKSVGLRLLPDVLEVVADPSLSERQIIGLLERRRDWIRARWQVLRQVQAQARLPLTHLWLQGRQLPLQFCGGRRVRVQLGEEAVAVYGLAAADAVPALEAALVRALVARARQVFPLQLEAFESCLIRPVAGWRLSSARTRWGSCTASGMIRLNWRLIQAPPDVLDYVLAHELAHLAHMNHSPAFRAELARLKPDWQSGHDWLKAHGGTLFRLG